MHIGSRVLCRESTGGVFAVVLAIFCGEASLVSAQAETTAAKLRGTLSGKVHPVLIRNDENAVQSVVITGLQQTVRVREVEVSWEGTDALDDIESTAVFVGGETAQWQAMTPLGTREAAKLRTVYRGDVALSEKANVLWISVRLRSTASLLRQVSASCVAIRTTAGDVDLGEPGLKSSHRIGLALRRHQDDGVHTYRIPALATSAKGTLLAVYDMRRRMGRDLQEDIDIGLSRSTAGGQSWEPVRVIMDMGEYGGLPQEQNGCSDPGLIVDRQTGEIFCFAVWMNGKPGKHQWTADGSEPGFEIGKSAQFLMVRSRDDGLTWSKPENLTRRLKKEAWVLFAPSPQQGIQLADGTLVMPSQGRDEQGREFSTIMVSHDHGQTWRVGNPAYVGGSECQVAQLGDGRLMLNMRNEKERFRGVMVTGDLGQTWSEHPTHRQTIVEPNCNGSLLRVDYQQEGTARHLLLFANPQSPTARTHHTIQVSFDDGLTWPTSHRRLLDEGRGAGYPSLTRIDDDHVGIVYEGSQAHLVFQKFRIQELVR